MRLRASPVTAFGRSAMPRSRAMATAVSGWSPVIMTGRMPAALQAATADLTAVARRVHQPDQAEKREIALDVPGAGSGRRCRERPEGHSQHPHAGLGQAVVRRADLLPQRIGERLRPLCRPDARAKLQQAVHGAFGEGHMSGALEGEQGIERRAAGGQAMDRGHPLAVRIKRHFGDDAALLPAGGPGTSRCGPRPPAARPRSGRRWRGSSPGRHRP